MNDKPKPRSAPKKTRSASGALTPERIVRVAFDFIDRNGMERLSMRAVAEELGCTHTALFWHFRTMDDLLSAVLQLALTEMSSDIPTEGPWDDRAKIICRRIRLQLLQHPVVLALGKRFPARGVSPFAPALTKIAQEAGYTGLEAVAAARMLLELVGGYAISQGGDREIAERLPPAFMNGALSVEDVEFVISYSKADPDRIFDVALEAVVDVLRRRAPILAAG